MGSPTELQVKLWKRLWKYLNGPNSIILNYSFRLRPYYHNIMKFTMDLTLLRTGKKRKELNSNLFIYCFCLNQFLIFCFNKTIYFSFISITDELLMNF